MPFVWWCCCDIAVELLGISVVLLWACCRLAAASRWYRCGIVVELLWTSAIFMWDDILLWDGILAQVDFAKTCSNVAPQSA